MKYLPALLILIVLVALMAGAGSKGVQATTRIMLAILGLTALIILFALVVARAL